MKDHIDTMAPEEWQDYCMREESQGSEPRPPRWGGMLNRLALDSRLPARVNPWSEVRFHPLFYSTSYERLLDHSPLLFELSGNKRNFVAYAGALPSTWGILWDGQASLELAKKHWQSLLTVVLPTGKLTHFRFYSPAVFVNMAGACTENELAWLLGPLAHVVAPAQSPRTPEEGAPSWLRISNPRLETESAQSIAEAYQALDKPWWQVTEEHLRAFADVLDRVYQDNLGQRVWEQYPELAWEADVQYGSVERFVAATLEDARARGFHTPEQEYRFLLLSLHYDFNSASCPHAQTALKLARQDPDAALVQLEEALRNPPHE